MLFCSKSFGSPIFHESYDADATVLDLEDYFELEFLYMPPIDPDIYSIGAFEGDIIGISEFDIQQYVRENNDVGRNAVKTRYLKWESGVIPYQISKKYDKKERKYIAKAFNEFHEKTCIRFVPRNARKHEDYIFIKPTGKGCFSGIGKWGHVQDLSLDPRCITPGTVMHELMHAVKSSLYVTIVMPGV